MSQPDQTNPVAVARGSVKALAAAAYTMLLSDDYIAANATGGAIIITLPPVAGCVGMRFRIRKVDASANTVTLDANGVETINGALTQVLANRYDQIEIEGDGTEWAIVGSYFSASNPNNTLFQGAPSGIIQAYSAAVAPTGWLICDGASILRTGVNAALFAVIGTSFGAADGTHFNVPDLRGRFLRGWDNGFGRDAGQAGGRTAMNAGGAVGDLIGSVEIGSTALPTTAFTVPTDDAAGADAGSLSLGVAAAGTRVVGGGDTETRPINANVQYIIKL
jgi:phage-related tail fiber protein